MSSRVSGSVKWFDNRKGFGFINNLANSAEVFVHHTGLSSQNGVFRTLYPGEYIEFDLHHDEQTKRDYAVNVTGVKGGALLCENQGTRLMVRRTRPAGQQQSTTSSSDSGFKTVQRRGTRPTRGRGGSARGSEQ
jgi:CspA family cold shock protein